LRVGGCGAAGFPILDHRAEVREAHEAARIVRHRARERPARRKAPSETATEEPSLGAPDEATRANASATPSVTAPTPLLEQYGDYVAKIVDSNSGVGMVSFWTFSGHLVPTHL
jgi:hypothetical protein